MAHVTPQFNIKTGSDSQLFFSREYTSGDVTANADLGEAVVGRIKDGEVVQDRDIFNYPQLTRRTGHSIKGSTETIESQELRKGRTKSAPRKGNSSSEGSLDIELSPETYDDIFEAALRNKWKAWTSDAKTAIKFDFTDTLKEDQFISNGTEKDGGLKAKYLVGWKKEKDASEAGRKDAIIVFENKAERDTFDIDELTCGTEDIKYSALAQYGGITGEDLYQEFQHLAVNTMSLSVSPGQIVTGSFGFMGSNNPDLLQTGDDYAEVKVADEEAFKAGSFYTRTGAGTELDPYVYAKATAYEVSKTYYIAPSGIIEELADDDARSKEGRFFKDYDKETEEVTGYSPAEVKGWVEKLATKTGTSTDQFTAREGFLFINGHRIQFGSNLTFDLNNGLKQIFAIFEKGSISTTPLSLDITGTLDAYLIKGHTEDLYNMCSGDKDVEITFCFQDKEDNPNYLYVMQIFKAKFTANDISQGAEELTVSLPFQSFEERACRMFRIRKRKVVSASLAKDVNNAVVTAELSSAIAGITADDFKITVKYDGEEKNVTDFVINGNVATWKCANPETEVEAVVEITYNGIQFTKKYENFGA